MDLPEVIAKRTESAEPFPTTWQPVDLHCAGEEGGDEMRIRTKLVRDGRSAAACLSEAIAHRVLSTLGVPVAEPFAVVVGAEFATTISAQFGFSPPVFAGRHWGTRVIDEALPTVLRLDHYEQIRSPLHVFLIYLADVILGYGDRQTHGNVLLVPVSGGRYNDVVPIDNSDCFQGPSYLCNPDLLKGKIGTSCAKPFELMERLVIEGGSAMVDGARNTLLDSREKILEAVTVPPDEWYGRAGIEPDHIVQFMSQRLDNIEDLARLPHWRGMSDAAGGIYGSGGNLVLI